MLLIVTLLSPWLFLGAVSLYFVAKCVYNVKFHPLAAFSGPTLWSASRLCYVIHLAQGDLHLKVKSLHDRYGSVVRVAPNELSFIEGAAWQDIYTGHIKNKGLPKNDIVFGAQEFRSMLDGDDDEHTRMRKLLVHSFSNQALNRQEGYLHYYVDKVLERFRAIAGTDKTLGMVALYNWLSFDVTGELAFSEPFGQLERKDYHPWVKMIVSHLKYSALSICLRFYQPLDKIMPLIAPPSLRQLKWSFVNMSREKVLRRLSRPQPKKLDDIFSYCLSPVDGKPIMSMEELVGTFTFLIVAGSETTATVLAGLTNYLCRTPRAMKQLKAELRSVQDESGFTIASTATMPYLNAVIKEGLRMCYPIPSALTRIVPPGGKLISGRFVPGDTFVGIAQFAAHFSESNFEAPYEFLPERWLGKPTVEDGRSVFQPFAVGGRNCIGQNLAWAEMRLVLARLIYNFDLEAADDVHWLDQKTYFLWEKEEFLVKAKAATKVSMVET